MAYLKRGGVKIREITRAEWPKEWRESYDRLSSVPCILHGAPVGAVCFPNRRRLTSFGWPQLFCDERGKAVEETGPNWQEEPVSGDNHCWNL